MIGPFNTACRCGEISFQSDSCFAMATAVEVFRELLQDEPQEWKFSGLTNAAFVYLALALDKLLDYNSRMTLWTLGDEVDGQYI